MSQLRQNERQFAARDVRVAVVTFEAGPLAMAYVRETQLSWPLLVDRQRTLYHAYGMERGRWRDILGMASWKMYAQLLARGRRLHRPTGDTRQLGGNVLIDGQAVVRLHHVGSGPADRPSVDHLLQVVDQTDQTSQMGPNRHIPKGT